jgi:hypothetical protein
VPPTAVVTRWLPTSRLGPVSLSALKSDRFIRVTAGKLPEAEYCFLDEVFKASSANIRLAGGHRYRRHKTRGPDGPGAGSF